MKIMNELPGNVRANIMNKLERRDLDSVHMGHASADEDNNEDFVVIAHERDLETANCYSVYVYNCNDDDFGCYADGLTYADALIRMGEYINE